MASSPEKQRSNPWVMRTYSGHSTAKASNELYRTNLAKGQTGLSIAFDLPTQTGYDPDDPRATGEVGKVGVPVAAALQMATSIPADCIRLSAQVGHLAPGRAADIVHFDDALHLKRVWRAGQAGQT